MYIRDITIIDISTLLNLMLNITDNDFYQGTNEKQSLKQYIM